MFVCMSRYCMEHTSKKSFFIYLKFKFHWASCILSGNPERRGAERKRNLPGSHRRPGLTARCVGSQTTATAPSNTHTPAFWIFVLFCLLLKANACWAGCLGLMYITGKEPRFQVAQRRSSTPTEHTMESRDQVRASGV